MIIIERAKATYFYASDDTSVKYPIIGLENADPTINMSDPWFYGVLGKIDFIRYIRFINKGLSLKDAKYIMEVLHINNPGMFKPSV